MSNDNSLFVGLEVGSGEEVSVPIFHTLTTGQTQLAGKTEVQKKFAKLLAEKGYKIVIFDTKENFEDYAGIGEEIPVCLRESTDPLVLLPLLESIFQRRLPTGYFSVLADISSNTKGFAEVIKRAKDMEKSSRSGWKQGVCRTLWELLERLENQLSKIETVSRLELPYEINRMSLNNFPQASQQLFIKNAFEDILHFHNHKTVPQLDECFKFLPQRWGSACARPIQDAITQLAITDSYVYLATQYLAPTDKNPLKACAVRLLGTQDHKTEAVHTLDLIPFRNLATEDDIMTLPLGHFYVVTKKWAKLTYFLPNGVSKELGKEVALGKKSSEYVRDFVLKRSQVQGDDDLVYKEKAEQLEKELEQEKEKRKLVEGKYSELSDSDAKLVDALEKKNHELKASREFREALSKFLFPDGLPKSQVPSTSEGKATLNLDATDLNVNVSHRDLTFNMATTDQKGQIMYVAVNDMPKDGFTQDEIAERLAEYGWNIPDPSLTTHLSANLPKMGLLIRVTKTKPQKYRIPNKIQVNVVKA